MAYDVDGNGSLDFEETRKFMSQFMALVGSDIVFDEDIFEQMFLQYDKDGSGLIEKHELFDVI